jgi:hypothetical protein
MPAGRLKERMNARDLSHTFLASRLSRRYSVTENATIHKPSYRQLNATVYAGRVYVNVKYGYMQESFADSTFATPYHEVPGNRQGFSFASTYATSVLALPV